MQSENSQNPEVMKLTKLRYMHKKQFLYSLLASFPVGGKAWLANAADPLAYQLKF